MQRDFGLIDEMFGIVIRNDKSRGYYIAELDEMTDNYKELLLNFELLSSINTDSVLQKYVLAEHRQNAIRHELIAPLLKAIRKRNPIEFDYTLVRHNGKIVHKRLMPHFLKESQYRWYLIGYDTDGKLKSFGVDRISAINILEDTQFLRDEHIDIPALFRDSYGIWNNPEDPVEEIVLKYDSVDGVFVKTLPLHHSQQILSEDETGITVKLRLRITNDFVMELLSRSRSVEVVAPHTLRTRLYDTLRQAAERNKPIETECD
ncbi:helix-turn-helix transcriptional regulator [Barnesiella intestinihominis]|uniref:helix-turn-helix transcriptional regulator n=1 Tax=Barnesiella intestinihominis TaxID=487174 RepID=UPI003F7B646D